MTHSTIHHDPIKARLKATWEAGDFGEVARYIEAAAADFMSRVPLRPGLRVLDAACGTGNLGVHAARAGCETYGLDIATNLIDQARARARREGLPIEYTEGDAEAMPYPDASFDVVVSMYGVMFAPRPQVIVEELLRVTRSGGLVALANWTPEGFIGKMFEVFKRHLPPPPPGIPSTMLWGDEDTVRERLQGFSEVKCTRRIARMAYPFPPSETVEFFRQYYGPTQKAFSMLDENRQKQLRADLVTLQTQHNTAASSAETEALAEYLEIVARRGKT
jgi:ubiquinone/menaquinone biosynthesis C-methylase UbiE